MAITNGILDVTANVSTATIYTSVGNSAITSMTLCNYSPYAVTANVYVVRAASTPSQNNIVMSTLPLQSGDTYQLYQAAEKLLLSTGDAIYATCSNATSVTAVVSYTNI